MLNTQAKFIRIAVWCAEVNSTIKPCVSDYNNNPPCGGKLCEPMLNYLRDSVAVTNKY